MIPKVIHYCWFGRSPLPESAIKCISSWRKFFPNYEIKEWNEENFDVNIIPYTAEAYQAKKYAFVSDYARFWILYNHGGLYFDTDVEVIRPLDDIVERGPYMGCENNGSVSESIAVAPGLGLGVECGHEIYKELLDYYASLHYLSSDGRIQENQTIVNHTTMLLVKKGLKNSSEIQCVSGIYVYPKEYFCPKDYNTGKLSLTGKSVAIHHYGATWRPWEQQVERWIWRKFGVKHHPLLTWHIDNWLGFLGIRR